LKLEIGPERQIETGIETRIEIADSGRIGTREKRERI
jgi:hypothetical protein